jgi:predicted CoA-binding protein
MGESKTVAILGASPKPDRFANRAMHKLLEHGHKVLLVNPAFEEIEGIKVYPNLAAIKEPVDTLTLYVGPERSAPLASDILDLRPQRVIFNPGTESPELMKKLEDHRIYFVRSCTLVMLDTGRF